MPKPTSQLQGSTVKIKKDIGTWNVRLIHGCSTWTTLSTLPMTQQSKSPHIHHSMSQQHPLLPLLYSKLPEATHTGSNRQYHGSRTWWHTTTFPYSGLCLSSLYWLLVPTQKYQHYTDCWHGTKSELQISYQFPVSNGTHCLFFLKSYTNKRFRIILTTSNC